MRSGFVDAHHHLLYGMDDGPEGFEETVRMLHRASKQGVTRLAATPHVRPGHPGFDMEIYLRRLDEARTYAVRNGLNLEISSGAEVFYTVSTTAWLQKGRVPPLGNSRNVLVEFFPGATFGEIWHGAMDIGNAGFSMVLAHAERYRALRWGDRLARLKEECGVMIQMNSDAVLGSCKPLGDRWIRRMLKDGLVDLIASDAHDTVRRPCSIGECAKALTDLYGQETAKKLCCVNPAAILSGEPVLTEQNSGEEGS